MSVDFYRNTRRKNLENENLQGHCYEKLKFEKVFHKRQMSNFLFLENKATNEEPCHGFGQLVNGPLWGRLALDLTPNYAVFVVYKLELGQILL